jgi:hypothetical protein
MRTKRELMTEILETAVIESVKSPDYTQVWFKDEHDILVHQGVIGYGKPSEKCDRIFNPWEIEEVLDYFLGHDEEENYELEAKADEEQSKLTIAVEEAKKEAKIEVLTKLKASYVDSHNEYSEADDDAYRAVIGMTIYGKCIQSIEKMLEELN